MRVVIIGNGIAGITAARFIRKKSDYAITVISGESAHFFSRTALMYVYMGHMEFRHLKPYEDDFWKKNRIELVQEWITEINVNSKVLKGQSGKSWEYDKLILATGSKPRFMDWPGNDAIGIQGLYSLQDLQQMEINTKGIKRAAVIGGGLIGIELAEMLHSRGIEVTILIRESHYWGNVLPRQEGELIGRHLEENHIRLLTQTGISRIKKDRSGKITGIVTDKGEEIECGFLGVAIGVEPNIGIIRNTPIESERGILVDAYLQTSIPDVYAIGDCAQHREPPAGRASVEQVWYTGKIMGETVAATLCGQNTPYRPGIWFNSAKFFDIEYQVYGVVPPEITSHLDEFYWEQLSKRRCIRVVWQKATGQFMGIHAFGIRLRQVECERWIAKGLSVSKALEQLEKACFDAEFSTDWVEDFRAAFTKAKPEIKIESKANQKASLSAFFKRLIRSEG